MHQVYLSSRHGLNSCFTLDIDIFPDSNEASTEKFDQHPLDKLNAFKISLLLKLRATNNMSEKSTIFDCAIDKADGGHYWMP